MLSNDDIAKFISALRGESVAQAEIARRVLTMNIGLHLFPVRDTVTGNFVVCEKGHPCFSVDHWPLCDDTCIPF